jgi:O-antigen/teichoic acid export membrane protein
MSIHRRRLGISIASGLVMEGLNKISPLLILYHAQKYLGLTAFGSAQYGIAWLEIIQSLVAFGYANYAVAAISRGHDSAPILSHVTALKIMQMLLVLLGVSILSAWQSPAHPLQSYFLLLALLLSGTVLDASWLALARQKVAYFSAFHIILRLGSLLAIFIWVRAPEDQLLFMLLQLAPHILMAVATAYFAWTRLGWSPVQRDSFFRIARGALPFAAISFLLMLQDRFDLFLMERWFGLEAAGAYAGPAKVVQSLAALGTSVVAAFSAEMVLVKDRDSLARHSALSLWCMLAIATPIVFGAPFVETEAMQLLFPHQPPAAHGIFRWLCLSIIAQVFITVFGLQVLQLKGEPWRLFLCLIPGLIAGPLLAWTLRSTYGWPVMAWALVASKGIAAFLVVIAARPMTGPFPWPAILRTLAPGACMALVLYGIVLQGILLQFIIGGIVYLSCLALLNRQKVSWVLNHPQIARYWRGWF